MRCICEQVQSGVAGVCSRITFTESFAEFVCGSIKSQPVTNFSSSSHNNSKSLSVLMRSPLFVMF